MKSSPSPESTCRRKQWVGNKTSPEPSGSSGPLQNGQLDFQGKSMQSGSSLSRLLLAYGLALLDERVELFILWAM